MRNPIIVALDVPEMEAALRLAEAVTPHVGAFKVGSELFTASGPEIVRRLRALGAQVFLDLKFHDIPNTVAKAVSNAVRLDVQMLTIHTCGGSEMMKAAEDAAQQTARQMSRTAPLVLGVTVLTSMDSNELSEVGCEANAARQVERLAALAVKSGLRGLVCSPLEVTTLRQLLPSHVALVTPGIRPPGPRSDDQKRTLSAAEAISAGSTYLVVGRPIYAAADPAAAAQEVLASISRTA
ncbi:MAG TPA: orotidine-5'-phosphate decarboxylase [Methylomirabilota bacterium]|nr:orotidine-5'-phosphate decarboxylase [Methylomirabilota bacterium]